MTADERNNVESHEGRPVGIKVQVDFSPEEARRVTELAEQAGLPLTQYLRRLVDEAAAARAR
jgi:hypothetical protein